MTEDIKCQDVLKSITQTSQDVEKLADPTPTERDRLDELGADLLQLYNLLEQVTRPPQGGGAWAEPPASAFPPHAAYHPGGAFDPVADFGYQQPSVQAAPRSAAELPAFVWPLPEAMLGPPPVAEPEMPPALPPQQNDRLASPRVRVVDSSIALALEAGEGMVATIEDRRRALAGQVPRLESVSARDAVAWNKNLLAQLSSSVEKFSTLAQKGKDRLQQMQQELHVARHQERLLEDKLHQQAVDLAARRNQSEVSPWGEEDGTDDAKSTAESTALMNGEPHNEAEWDHRSRASSADSSALSLGMDATRAEANVTFEHQLQEKMRLQKTISQKQAELEGLNAKLQQLTTDLREQSFAGGQLDGSAFGTPTPPSPQARRVRAEEDRPVGVAWPRQGDARRGDVRNHVGAAPALRDRAAAALPSAAALVAAGSGTRTPSTAPTGQVRPSYGPALSHLRERSPATPAVKATAKPAAAAAVKRTQPLVSQPAPVKEGFLAQRISPGAAAVQRVRTGQPGSVGLTLGQPYQTAVRSAATTRALGQPFTSVRSGRSQSPEERGHLSYMR